MTASRTRESGAAMVEAPIAIAVLLMLAFGAFWIANIGVRHHQLNEAVNAASRYGARSYYAPGGNVERRRSIPEIKAFATKAAGPLADTIQPGDIEVFCGSDPGNLATCADSRAVGPGDFIEVRVTARVESDDPITSIARSVNGLLGSIGAGDALPERVRMTESSIAIVE